jgi:hypothetical protein
LSRQETSDDWLCRYENEYGKLSDEETNKNISIILGGGFCFRCFFLSYQFILETEYSEYYFLAFHTKEQHSLFFNEYYSL